MLEPTALNRLANRKYCVFIDSVVDGHLAEFIRGRASDRRGGRFEPTLFGGFCTPFGFLAFLKKNSSSTIPGNFSKLINLVN